MRAGNKLKGTILAILSFFKRGNENPAASKRQIYEGGIDQVGLVHGISIISFLRPTNDSGYNFLQK